MRRIFSMSAIGSRSNGVQRATSRSRFVPQFRREVCEVINRIRRRLWSRSHEDCGRSARGQGRRSDELNRLRDWCTADLKMSRYGAVRWWSMS